MTFPGSYPENIRAWRASRHGYEMLRRRAEWRFCVVVRDEHGIQWRWPAYGVDERDAARNAVFDLRCRFNDETAEFDERDWTVVSVGPPEDDHEAPPYVVNEWERALYQPCPTCHGTRDAEGPGFCACRTGTLAGWTGADRGPNGCDPRPI